MPRLVIGVALALLLSPRPVHAQAFLEEMPEPARVTREIRGSDEVDTAARQYGALNFLQSTLQMRYYVTGRPFPDPVRQKYDRYEAAKKALVTYAHRNDGPRCANESCPGWRFGRLVMIDYAPLGAAVGPFQQDILKQFFSPQWRADYAAAIRPRTAAVTQPGGSRRANSGEGANSSALMILASIGAVWGGIFVLTVVGILAPAGLSGDVSQLTVGFRRYIVHTVTGVVMSPTRSFETRTYVSGNANNVMSSNQTFVHEQFFIKHPHGETSIQLVDVNLPLREGHCVSAAWAIRKGRKQGPYFFFRNHSTSEQVRLDGALRGILRPTVWPLLIFLVSLWALVLLSIPNGPSFERSFEQSGYGPMAANATIWGTVGWLMMRAIVGRWRVRRFRKKDVKRLVDVLDDRATHVGAGADGWVTSA